MNQKLLVSISACLVTLCSSLCHAQGVTLLKEDFTGATTQNQWYFYNGACLTASTASAAGNPGVIPGCTTIRNSYYKENLTGGVNGDTSGNQTLPDPGGQGALRFTNGSPGGFNQNGAIISAKPLTTVNGLNITFATISYRGNSSGNGGSGNNNNISDPGYNLPISGGDGADGMSFFLLDGTKFTPQGAGSYGGSLGYTCSNSNPGYTGILAGYLGLGIDEYGNFLNPGDNTNSGPGLQANRIGLRGAGSVNFTDLTTNHAMYYPANLKTIYVTLPNGNATWNDGVTPGTAADWALYDTCRTGKIWDYSKVTSAATLNLKTQTNLAVEDYPTVPNGYTVLSGVKIANEYSSGGIARVAAEVAPIYYRLKITSNGLLSLQYSYNGGAYTYVLQNQAVSTINPTDPLPNNLYFGFAGSTGGANNIHEILCFQAAPATQAASSAATAQRQGAALNPTSQVFFSLYNPNDWTGNVQAWQLVLDESNPSTPVLTFASAPTWDGSCVLTGETASECPTGKAATLEQPVSRRILSWDGGKGVAFQMNSLNSTQQAALTTLDSSLAGGAVAAALCAPACRLNYLRGDRTQEVDPYGHGLFRDRDNVLGDIIDSSPVWVGPPLGVIPKAWRDRAHSILPANPYPENATTAQSYASYIAAQQSRPNVVYVGSNDGMVHGFRAGAVDITGQLTGAVPNDGYELMAYMPGSVISSATTAAASTAAAANNCSSLNALPTEVQEIHGAVPMNGSAPACVQAALDFSNTQYGHNYFVDSTPVTGDVFYNGLWHTWLVGTLGYGGAGIYALDVTNPGSFSESNAKALVMGEWTPSSLTCTDIPTSCGVNLGQITNAPIIRRLHNGTWGIIFGNGINSASGDAGIYILTIPQSTISAPLAPVVYYLSTGSSGGNGMTSVAGADLDNDSIVDYVYGTDIKGHVWRFDLTSITPPTLAAGSAPPTQTQTSLAWSLNPLLPMFKTQSGQPLTTRVVAASGPGSQASPQIMVAFGTGEKYPLTNTNGTSYQTGTQSMYGFWDWDMDGWNNLNPALPYATLSYAKETSCVAGLTLTSNNVVNQTVFEDASGVRHELNPAAVIWPTPASCTGAKFGWEIDLPDSQEQIVFQPQFQAGMFDVNSLTPAKSTLLSCKIVGDGGASYAVSMLTGTPGSGYFQNYSNDTIGLPTNGSGTSAVVTDSQSEGHTWLVMQTDSGQGTTVAINPPVNLDTYRITWKQMR
ncbi:MAG TPA: PilC/PilY family type IV pilus protein [Steroidobacteraceae bacterium]|nr:PilC/PilY family type IV pilus protein [Steroidobacteraceae bacterium]